MNPIFSNFLFTPVSLKLFYTILSKFHRTLKDISLKKVVVEEAAHVFESHIIASLTSSTEHLILLCSIRNIVLAVNLVGCLHFSILMTQALHFFSKSRFEWAIIYSSCLKLKLGNDNYSRLNHKAAYNNYNRAIRLLGHAPVNASDRDEAETKRLKLKLYLNISQICLKQTKPKEANFLLPACPRHRA